MAFIKELGYSGATKFILLYEAGEGDYTKERKKLFKNIAIEEIIKDRIADTLADPDEIRRSSRFGNARLFSRWFDAVRSGKHVVVVVVTYKGPTRRSWIVTAHIARKLMEGEVEWRRS